MRISRYKGLGHGHLYRSQNVVIVKHNYREATVGSNSIVIFEFALILLKIKPVFKQITVI